MLFHKHAIWCQCASLISTTLALSALFSMQRITWNQDIYWSIVLGTTTFLNITVAEHGFRPEIMAKIASVWSGIVYMLIVTGNNNWFSYVGTIIGMIIGAIVPQYSYLILLLALFSYPSGLTIVLIVKVSAEYKYKDLLNSVVGKTTANINVKKAIGAKAIGIVSETLLLWHLRCHYRFPHLYRWTPVVYSLCMCSCGIVWCHYYIAPTVVCRKSVIRAIGHGLTPSLQAAKKCKVCSSTITHLDIEDVFD